MTFKIEETGGFINLFDQKKEKIRGFEGCHHLSLLRHDADPRIFFTYSIWEDETSLNAYRCSPLFKETWSATKVLFEEPAEAWSLNKMRELA